MNVWFVLSGLVAVVGFFVHVVLGGRSVVRRLLGARELGRSATALLYLCWHIVSLDLALIAAVMFASGVGWLHRDAALVGAGVALVILVVSVAGLLSLKLNPLRFPPTYLSALMAALAFVGLA